MAVSRLAYVGIGVSDMARWNGWGGRLVDDATWLVQRHDRGGLWGHKVQLEPAPRAATVTAGR